MTWTLVTPSQSSGWGENASMMSRLTQEDGVGLLLEDGGSIFLEALVSTWVTVTPSQIPGWI